MPYRSADVGRTSASKLIYVFGALGGMLFGYDTAVISGAILFINQEFGLSPVFSGLVVSALLGGAMVGAATAGWLSDKVGRKRLLLAAGIIFTIGALGVALASSAAVLVLFRFALGLAVGSASFIVPLYLVELAPTESRGSVATLNTLAFSVGALAAYAVNAALANAEAWRWMLGLAVIPSLAMIIGVWFLPESPRSLVRRDREREARSVLRLNRDEKAVEYEIQNIKEVMRHEAGGLRELLAPWIKPALIVGLGLAIFQQLIGINTVIYYAPTILTNVGFGDSAAITSTLGVGIVSVANAVLAIYLIDRVGRKLLLLGGSAVMTSSLGVVALISLLFPEPTGVGPTSIAILGCLLVFQFCFGATWGPAVWILLGEIFPLKVRGAAAGLAATVLWAVNLAISLSFPPLVTLVGIGYVFLGFAILGIAAFLFVLRFVTETKGRSLEEIEAELMRRHEGRSGETIELA